MTPRTLEEWTIPLITTLLAQGYYESREFDFKQMLPDSRDEGEKERLRAACCAFANSPGGFLVFGVTDKKTDPVQQRLVGLPPAFDFPEHFGVYPQQCTPAVHWQFRQPALLLPQSGNAIHVVQIPQSWSAPHFYRPEASHPERWRFPKRTDKGTEDMSYEEVRLAFLQYYEKRVKLQLLRAELDTILAAAKDMQNPWPAQSAGARGEFGLTVVETVLADTYTILASAPDVQDTLSALARIRTKCRDVNQEMQRWMTKVGYEFLEPTSRPLQMHNGFVQSHCSEIEIYTSQVIRWLDKLLAKPE